MKKMLALLLALAMLASLMAGCAKKAESAETTAAETAQETAAETAAETTAETAAQDDETSTWLCDEKTTLSVFTFDAVSSAYLPPSNDLAFWQWLEDYTNVHIEWETSPFSGYDEVIATKLASGSDLSDIIMCRSTTNSNNAGENGLLVNMADYWDTCFSNTKNHFEEAGMDYTSLISNEDGSIYALCGTVEPVEGHITFMYNTEWMEKLGAEIPTTLDEFTALLQQMQEAGDLNGNGENDEVMLSSSGIDNLSSVLGNAFGLEQYEGWDAFVADDSGKVSDEYTTDNMKAYLSYLNDLYTKGLLDNEICTMSSDALSEKIASDRVGVFVYYSSFAIGYGSLTPAGIEDPNGEHYTLGGPLASEYNNNEGYYVRREKLDTSATAVSSSCENPELAMKWLDTLFADPEVLKIRTCGFEGEDWETDANGDFQLIYPADGSAWNISAKGCGQIALCFIQTADQLLNSKRQYTWYMDEYDGLRENAKWVSPSVPKVSSFTASEQELLDYCKTDVITYWKEMRDKFIKGEASLDSDWSSYLSNMDQLGLATFTEAYQSVCDRAK